MPAVLRNYTPVTEARLRSPNDGDWRMNRRTYDGWGYSPLTQITPANVARLKPVAEAARAFQRQEQYGAWIHEAHHATKKDAPSGAALMLRDTMTGDSYSRPIDMSSTRAGAIPGIHTVGFDGASDTIELTHTARDRRGFAAGALLAAQWIRGRRGWFTMKDVLKG